MTTNIEKKRRYYDGSGNLILEVENGADAVNVDFNAGNSGMESTNVNAAIIEAYGHSNANAVPNNIAVTGQDVFLGDFEQNGNWVRQTCIVSPVDYNIVYHFSLPDDVVAKVEYGNDHTISSTSNNISNGGTFTVGAQTRAHRISFAKYTNGSVAELTLTDANTMIANGSIRVWVDDDDVIAHNLAKEPMLGALKKLNYRDSADPSSQFFRGQAPLIAHTSDLHGDSQRMWNMCKFAERHGIDTCITSGDQVIISYDDGGGYAFAAAKKAGVHMMMCIGNHEVQYTSSTVNFPAGNQSDGANFNNHIGATNAEYFGYKADASNNTERAYYYHDFASKRLRVIVLDQHDGGVYSANNSATDQGGRISQAQFTWFIATLKSTPANYGIVIVMHSPENGITRDNNHGKFFTTCPTSGNDGDSYSYAPDGMYCNSSRPIAKIVDAFISKGTCSGTFTQTYKGSSETIDYGADFTSGVNTGVEFICYLNGHIHQDRVGYLDGTTNTQLNINVCSGSACGATSPDDLPRYGTGATQDAFNVYAIDRVNKQVRIMRIGSNVKKDFTMRDFEIMNYATT